MTKRSLDSYMFHTPLIELTLKQAQLINLPVVIGKTKGEKEKEIESRIEKREERGITNCSEISSKVINRKTQLEKTVNNYSNSINRVETVIKARIDALKKDGKDTSEIEGNLAKYKSESQVLLNQRKELLNQLQTTSTTNCQTNRTALTTNIKKFNELQKSLLKSQQDLNKYLKENVVAKIKSLKGDKNEQ